jgi:hypothetical protein
MTLEPRKDWCPLAQDHVHSYYDYSYWVKHSHPVCWRCGFVDTSREVGTK